MSKLEQMVERRERREARIRERAKIVNARIAMNKERKETREIQKFLREKFIKLRRLTKAMIHDRELRFKYKNQDFYITQRVHHHEAVGVDDWSEDYTYFDLCRREPYSSETYSIFNRYWQPDLDKKDHTDKAIEGLRWFTEDKRHE